jgi:hypothetical protein
MGPYALISGLAAAWLLVMIAGEWLTRDKG